MLTALLNSPIPMVLLTRAWFSAFMVRQFIKRTAYLGCYRPRPRRRWTWFVLYTLSVETTIPGIWLVPTTWDLLSAMSIRSFGNRTGLTFRVSSVWALLLK